MHPPLNSDDEALLRRVSISGHWLGTRVDDLSSLVGGIDALVRLDANVLPQCRLDPSSLGAHEALARAVIAEIQNPENLKLLDGIDASGMSRARLFDDETVTIAHQLLRRVLDREPTKLTNIKDTRRIAAALVWAAMRGSRQLTTRQHRCASDLWWWFAVNDATKIALKLVAAAGCTGRSDRVWESARQRHLVLDDPRLLHSEYRAHIIRQRDEWIAICRRRLDEEEASRPIRVIDNGKVCIRAAQLPPLIATKTLLPTGALTVVVGFGHDHDEANLFALTIPEARRLVALVERALADPCPDLNRSPAC
jgi:hypothetical protein